MEIVHDYMFEIVMQTAECNLEALKEKLLSVMRSPVVYLEATWPVRLSGTHFDVTEIDSNVKLQEMLRVFLVDPRSQRRGFVRLLAHKASSSKAMEVLAERQKDALKRAIRTGNVSIIPVTDNMLGIQLQDLVPKEKLKILESKAEQRIEQTPKDRHQIKQSEQVDSLSGQMQYISTKNYGEQISSLPIHGNRTCSPKKLKTMKKVWKSVKKGLGIKRSKSKGQKSTLPLQPHANDASQQETPNNSNSNTINPSTGGGKKANKGFNKGLNKIVRRASKLADKVMDGMCMPRARGGSSSHSHPQEDMAAHPASPTIKAIRADTPHDQTMAETIVAVANGTTKIKIKTDLKAVTSNKAKTLQWKTPVQKMKRVSLCLPCMSGAATMTKA